MYQPLWRIKHHGDEALVVSSPDGAAATAFVYRYHFACEDAPTVTAASLTLLEKPVDKAGADHDHDRDHDKDMVMAAAVVAWFYDMDHDQVSEACARARPPAHALDADDWLQAVVRDLLDRHVLFWEGETEADLVALGLVDARRDYDYLFPTREEGDMRQEGLEQGVFEMEEEMEMEMEEEEEEAMYEPLALMC